jgi:hypothetical protein
VGGARDGRERGVRSKRCGWGTMAEARSERAVRCGRRQQQRARNEAHIIRRPVAKHYHFSMQIFFKKKWLLDKATTRHPVNEENHFRSKNHRSIWASLY